MTLEYRCSNCGTLLQTTNADPLDAEIRRLRAALEEVINPLAAMKRRAEADGNILSGMAYSISRDPNYLQDIARKALSVGALGSNNP